MAARGTLRPAARKKHIRLSPLDVCGVCFLGSRRKCQADRWRSLVLFRITTNLLDGSAAGPEIGLAAHRHSKCNSLQTASAFVDGHESRHAEGRRPFLWAAVGERHAHLLKGHSSASNGHFERLPVQRRLRAVPRVELDCIWPAHLATSFHLMAD